MKMLIVWLSLLLLLSIPLLSLAGSEPVHVVLVPKISGPAADRLACEGALRYAQDHGYLVSCMGSPQASAASQITLIQNAINSGADAICLSSVDAKGLDDIMKQARKDGLALTTFGSDISGDARSLMVAPGTPQKMGRLLVDMLAQSLVQRGLNIQEKAIQYVWHYANSNTQDQISWHQAGEEYIAKTYPHWVNLATENYYSQQNERQAVLVGETILSIHPGIDGILCSDPVALAGQAQAAANLGLKADDISITGFAPPEAMKEYAQAGILARWAFWDIQMEAAIACSLARDLALGMAVRVGDQVSVPDYGRFIVYPNSILQKDAYLAQDRGIILIDRVFVITSKNMDSFAQQPPIFPAD